jgi:hypothetical protein
VNTQQGLCQVAKYSQIVENTALRFRNGFESVKLAAHMIAWIGTHPPPKVDTPAYTKVGSTRHAACLEFTFCKTPT